MILNSKTTKTTNHAKNHLGSYYILQADEKVQ